MYLFQHNGRKLNLDYYDNLKWMEWYFIIHI